MLKGLARSAVFLLGGLVVLCAVKPIGNIPPVELEQVYYRMQQESAMAAGLN